MSVTQRAVTSVAVVVVLVAALAVATRGAAPADPVTLAVATALPVPSDEVAVTGGSYYFDGPDGTRYHVIHQINRVGAAAPTPSPTAAPSSSPSPAPTIVTVDDAAFTYFGAANGLAPATTTAWAANDLGGLPKYGVGDHSSTTTAAAYGLIFTGTQVRLYAATAPFHGIASVSLDSAAASDVDLYSAARADQALIYDSGVMAAGIHRVLVRVTGRKNAASTNVVVAADRADIVGGAIIPPLSK